MVLRIKNKDLVTFFEVLEKISVSNMRANRGRARLLRYVREKLQELIKDEQEILSAYVVVDEAGELARSESGDFVLKDPGQKEELSEMLLDLQNETVALSFRDYEERYQAFMVYLSECEESFSSEQILVIDELLEQFEKGEVT